MWLNLWPIWLAIAIAAALTIAAMIILVGHQTEERPGLIDLTGIKPRRGYDWPPASRARAEVRADPDWTCDVRLVDEKSGAVVRDWWSPARGEVVTVPPRCKVDVRERADLRVRLASSPTGVALAERLTETELARRVATQQQPRGADAA